jgi:hypothetical protein
MVGMELAAALKETQEVNNSTAASKPKSRQNPGHRVRVKALCRVYRPASSYSGDEMPTILILFLGGAAVASLSCWLILREFAIQPGLRTIQEIDRGALRIGLATIGLIGGVIAALTALTT